MTTAYLKTCIEGTYQTLRFTILSMNKPGKWLDLSEFICEDAKKEGFDYVEAYPFIEETNPYDFYVGFQKFYEKMGFRYEKKTKHRFVMRKALT